MSGQLADIAAAAASVGLGPSLLALGPEMALQLHTQLSQPQLGRGFVPSTVDSPYSVVPAAHAPISSSVGLGALRSRQLSMEPIRPLVIERASATQQAQVAHLKALLQQPQQGQQKQQPQQQQQQQQGLLGASSDTSAYRSA